MFDVEASKKDKDLPQNTPCAGGPETQQEPACESPKTPERGSDRTSGGSHRLVGVQGKVCFRKTCCSCVPDVSQEMCKSGHRNFQSR